MLRALLGLLLLAAGLVLSASAILPLVIKTSPEGICWQRPTPHDSEFLHEGNLPDGEYTLWPVGVRCTYSSALDPSRTLVIDEPTWGPTLSAYGGLAIALTGGVVIATSYRRR
jgi:hypothetical protein